MNERKWGVVQALMVEADTHESLLAAVTIALTAHQEVSYWGQKQETLILYWSAADNSRLLPSPLKDPLRITQMIEDWLETSARYPSDEPDTDGSIRKGYRVEIAYGYVTLQVTPVWIVYGK